MQNVRDDAVSGRENKKDTQLLANSAPSFTTSACHPKSRSHLPSVSRRLLRAGVAGQSQQSPGAHSSFQDDNVPRSVGSRPLSWASKGSQIRHLPWIKNPIVESVKLAVIVSQTRPLTREEGRVRAFFNWKKNNSANGPYSLAIFHFIPVVRMWRNISDVRKCWACILAHCWSHLSSSVLVTVIDTCTVFTGTRGSQGVTSGSYPFEFWEWVDSVAW